jgi:hypothetical protein
MARDPDDVDAGYPDPDDPHWRQLTLRETAFWYGLAGVTYLAASVVEKGLLNWVIGPVWLVAVVWFGPLLADRLRGRGRRVDGGPG